MCNKDVAHFFYLMVKATPYTLGEGVALTIILLIVVKGRSCPKEQGLPLTSGNTLLFTFYSLLITSPRLWS